jgi:TolB-like protein/DNA-binding winged helix-turn-helix (wHTH) protein/Tfp pilus assembly protein PilF
MKDPQRTVDKAPTWRFAGYRLDPQARSLVGPEGERIVLAARAFDVLVYLVEHAQRIVPKDELLAKVWPGRVVEENNLSQAVSVVRRALGTDASDHRYIVTIPGRGYRFVAAVTPEDESLPGAPVAPAAPERSPDRVSRLRLGTAVLVVALVVAVGWVMAQKPSPVVRDARAPSQSSVAVLPFAALSDDGRDRLLTLGLADTLITRLSREPSLRVRSLASAERTSGATRDPLAAGRDLGADFVLDGSTQRSGARVRVNVWLLSVGEGAAIWADTYDAAFGDVFAAQDDIAAGVVRALSLPAGSLAAAGESPCSGGDAEAYRAYLSGHHLIQSPSPDGLRRAIGEFRRATDRDPACARAWAGQAFAWRGMSITGDIHPAEAFALARAAVDKALALDPQLAEAYASRGFIEFWHDWDWDAAEASFRRAIELNPSLAEARMGYAHLLSNLGRFDAALPQAREARELDPLSPLVNTLEAAFLHAGGQSAAADVRIERALELAPQFWIAFLTRGIIALDNERTAKAVADFERASELSGGATQALAYLAAGHARNDDPAAARAILDRLEQRAAVAYVPPCNLAAVHLALGDAERALDLLEVALSERDVGLAFLKTDSRWDALRQHPRFIAIAAQLRLD